MNRTRFGKCRFGLQKSVNFRRPPRLHPDSVLGVLILDGKLIKSIFIWIQSNVHICFEAASVDVLLKTVFLFKVLRHLILAHGPCIEWSPLGTRPRVGVRPKPLCGRPPTFIYLLAAARNTWVLFYI